MLKHSKILNYKPCRLLTMPGKNTAEYHTIIRNRHKLQLSFKNYHILIGLTSKLISSYLISLEEGIAIRNRHVDVEERAAHLLDLITIKIEENEVNYHTFVRILRDSGATYKDVIGNLESTYRTVKTELKIEEDLAKVQIISKPGILHTIVNQ